MTIALTNNETVLSEVGLKENMEQRVWSATDSVMPTGERETADNATVAMPTTLSNPLDNPLVLKGGLVISTIVNILRCSFSGNGMHVIIGLVISIIGSLAIILVITVLALARREHGSNVNTLIINQSAMDLLACVSAVVVLIRGFVHPGKHIADSIICGVFTATGVLGGKIGLVVITLERYFMIVHAIAHRKYYRDWMTKVGVALPWIGATCLVLIPSVSTSRITKGSCLKVSLWQDEGMAKVRK